MVAAVQSLRLCARACSRAPAPRTLGAQFLHHQTRSFSSTRAWRSDDNDAPTKTDGKPTASEPKTASATAGSRRRSDKVVLGLQEGMNDDEKEAFRAALAYADENRISLPARWAHRASSKEIEAQAESLRNYVSGSATLPEEVTRALDNARLTLRVGDKDISDLNRTARVSRTSFWGEGEEDNDYITEDIDEEDVSEEDILSLAHGKLEEFREYREYARIAAWQMPLLSKLARPFEPPTKEECLRFRYTTYMGEDHPAQSKVVVEFSTKDLPLNAAQAMKLKKLLGPRWNPETQLAKMSCEQFDHQAQNKRYLSDLINKLIAEAKDTTDTFEDVALDTRHHKIKPKPRFPKDWYLTVDRVQQLEDYRQKALLLDQAREDAGSLVDGEQVIENHFKQPQVLTVPAHLRAPSLSPGRPGLR